MNQLLEVIEEIGKLYDPIDRNVWTVAEAVDSAYAEFPQYKQGLTKGLKYRLKKTHTQLYNYRLAVSLKNKIGEAVLSVSHYAKLEKLGTVYSLELHEIRDYIQIVIDEHLSVEELGRIIHDNHDPDQDEQEKRAFQRMLKMMRTVREYAIFGELPEQLRTDFYRVLQELESYEIPE
jgi:hypothetical protein